MMRETGFELIDRLGGDARRQDFMQPQESVVIALEPSDAGSHAQARLGRLFDGRQPRQRRQTAVRLVAIRVPRGLHNGSLVFSDDLSPGGQNEPANVAKPNKPSGIRSLGTFSHSTGEKIFRLKI